jgi:histone acetyltransferase
VVFCAISTSEQVKGYGRATMSQLKEQIKVDYETLKYPMKMDYFLTFADNHATTFFRKQGFTDKLTIPRDRFSGYIKEYDGGQLMESFISYDIDYSNVPVLVAEQRKRVNGVIQKMSKSHIVYKGLQEFTIAAGEGKKTVVAIEDISGVLDAGWVRRRDLPKRDKDAAQPTPLTDMQARLGMIWKCIRQLKDSWPFQKAVDRKLVSDYYEVIAEPMDLATMNNRLNNSYYVSKESFVYDFMLIINNCKQYNDKGTTYHRCADTLLGAFTGLLQTFGLD